MNVRSHVASQIFSFEGTDGILLAAYEVSSVSEEIAISKLAADSLGMEPISPLP